MSNLKRNHYCGTLAKADNEQEVVLCGWVAKRRDHGGLIFIDLRDRSGIVQVVVDPDHAGEDFAEVSGHIFGFIAILTLPFRRHRPNLTGR